MVYVVLSARQRPVHTNAAHAVSAVPLFSGAQLDSSSWHQLRACSPLRDHRSAMPPRRRRLVRQGPGLPPLQGRLGSTTAALSDCCTSDGASGGVPAAPPAAVPTPTAAAPASHAPTLHATDAGVTASAVAAAGAPAATAAGWSRVSRCCCAPEARRGRRQEPCCVPPVACCPGGGRACCGCCGCCCCCGHCWCGGGSAVAVDDGGAPTTLQP